MLIRRILGGCCVVILSTATIWAAGTEVADAVASKNKQVVRTLLQQKADVNAPQTDGTTALHWAVRWDDLETADLLIKAGANVMASNRNGATPMYLATVNGTPAMVDMLLRAGADANATFLTHGETALMFASRTGNVEVVKMLLDRGANVNAKETLRDTTAVSWAAEQNHAEVIRLLAEKGADVKVKSKVVTPTGGRGGPPIPTGGLSPLVFAAREGGLEAVKNLIAAGADPNQTTGDGSSAMLVAIQNGHYPVAEFLLNNGADPDLANAKGWSPLYLTVKHRNIETGTIPVPNVAQATPFIYKLLEKGADPNVRSKTNTEIRNGQRATWFNEAGATPFIRAALCGDIEIMKLLLRYGADPGLTTNDRSTALMAAAGVGYAEGFIQHRSVQETVASMQLLLDLGADINAQNEGGLTALHGAAHKAVVAEIKLLLDWGARADIRDRGKTTYGDIEGGLLPLDWAEGVTVGVQSAIYHKDAVEIITKYMTDQGIPIPARTRTLGGNAKVGNVK